MRTVTLLLLLAPALALAQAAPPPPTLSPEETTQELAKLHSQVTTLQDQLGPATGDLDALQQRLQAAEEREQAFRQQVDELQSRGADAEQQRVARIQELNRVGDQGVGLDYAMSLGSTDLDASLAQLQASLEGVRQSTGATGGRTEYGADTNALLAIQAARQALADGDYFTARGYLNEVLSYSADAQAAAGANPQRAWTGQ